MKISKSAIIKANRKRQRDAELELKKGFTSRMKVHKNKKAYSRKSVVKIDI